MTSHLNLPLILEPAQLQDNLNAENLLIIDLSSEQAYLAGHVPGAVFVSPTELISGCAPVPGKLPSEEQLTQLFSRLGLNEDIHIVAYDNEGGGWAGRLIWTLDVIGHSRYSYLNGGILSWKAEARPLQTQPNTPQPAAVKIGINATPIATVEDIVSLLQDPAFAVWDARTAEEYRGEKVLALKAGHIPGAIHCEWTDLMDRQRNLRVREDAETYLAARGLTKEKKIVTHCQSHHRSGFTYLVGKTLGFDIRGYDGSWAEWGNHPDTPVER